MQRQDQHVLVYGGSGVRGQPVVRQLVARGARVRALARNGREADLLEHLGAQPVLGNLGDPASLRRAHEGIEAVFLQLPVASGAEHGGLAVDAARQAGVQHFVFTTNAPVPPESTDVPNIEDMRTVEAHLRASGLPGIVLRPMFYMENFAGPWTAPGIVERGVVAYPVAAHIRVPWISAEDAARLVVEALGRRDLAGSTFDIGGKEHLDGPNVAAHFSRALGRNVQYHAVPLDEFEAGLNGTLGAPAGTEVTKIYRWLGAHPGAPERVDMRGVLVKLPVPLTSLEDWARGRSEFRHATSS